MPKLKDLPIRVEITVGFPGRYDYKGGTSYYLAVSDTEWAKNAEIHFSLKGGDNDKLADYHITPEVLSGTNVGIWYKSGGKYSNTNLKNLPSHKKAAFDKWWADNEENCKNAAADFWKQLIQNARPS